MNEHRSARVLLVTSQEQTASYFSAMGDFEHLTCTVWSVSGLEHARFFLQHQAAEAVLIDESILETDPELNLRWLTEVQSVPVIFLSEENPVRIASAFRESVALWLPRRLAHGHPEVLEEGLSQCLRKISPVWEVERISRAFRDQEQQISRLTNMLWQVTPAHSAPQWHSQRTMLERLHEEMLRSHRYGQPLSVVLGEVRAFGGEPASLRVDLPDLCLWTAERVNRQRRRSDIAGQYGPNGFMLLLPSTEQRGAEDCCQRLRTALETPIDEQSPTLSLSVRSSFGMASTTEEIQQARQLLRKAEERLLEPATVGLS